MSELYDVFLDLLSFYLNGKFNKNHKWMELDWDSLYNLASIHSLSGIVAAVIKRANIEIPADAEKKFQKSFLNTCMYSVRLEAETERLIKFLNENMIPHLFSKGYLLRDLYLDKELRTMGDVDLLILDNKFDLAVKLAENAGYKVVDTYLDEVSFDINGIHYEFHSALMTESLGNAFDYRKYFNSLCSNPEKIDNYSYRLKSENHLLYLIAHIGKHFYNEGCGIRMILDIAVYLKAMSDMLDWEYIKTELEKINLLKFANNIFYLCGRWFQSNVPAACMSDELYEEIKKYIMEAGTFGFYARNPGTKIARIDYERRDKLAVFSWFFPDDEVMRQLSKWYKDKPAFMLPAAWAKRWVDSLRKKGVISVKKAFGAITNKSEARKQINMLKELGLYQNMEQKK